MRRGESAPSDSAVRADSESPHRYNGHYLPSFLQEAGFGTYYVGKLMNDYKASNFNLLPAQGWTDCDFLVDPNTYDYWNASFAKNSELFLRFECARLTPRRQTRRSRTTLENTRPTSSLRKLSSLSTKPPLLPKPPSSSAVRTFSPFSRFKLTRSAVAPIAPHSHIDSSVSDPRNIVFDFPNLRPATNISSRTSRSTTRVLPTTLIPRVASRGFVDWRSSTLRTLRISRSFIGRD